MVETIGNRANIEQVVTSYFVNVNTWYLVLDRPAFEVRLRELWANPSADVCLVVLCMFLVNKLPRDSPSGTMRDGLYLSVKSALALVEAQVTLSISLLQSRLLIALYENSHSMTQQAFVTLGSCVQMTRAFGWNRPGFWSEDRQREHPQDLKDCCLIWWTMVAFDWSVVAGCLLIWTTR